MRIIALVVLAAIIVAGGFWLARDRDGGTPSTESRTVVGDGSTETGAANGTPGTDVAQGDDEPAQEAPSGATEEPTAPSGEGTDAGTPEDATEPGDADAVEGEDAADQPALPDGFTALEYVTEEPRQSFDAPEQVLDPALDYAAVLRTNRGDITVDLYEEQTPTTVNNFVFLALHRYYQGVPFHRVLDGFMAQTGDPTGTGSGGPGYVFDDEIVPELSFDGEGILAMANAGTDEAGNGTNGSQFFITFAATAWLDGNHTIFGRVIDGLEVLPEITRIDPSSPNAVVPYDGTVADLAEQGVELPAEPEATVSDTLAELLGALPSPGQSFSVAGYRGVAGQLGNQPAFGFFANPDVLESVVIATRPR